MSQRFHEEQRSRGTAGQGLFRNIYLLEFINLLPQVEEWLAKGDYIIKELEALYMLKKYRTLKRRYYDEEGS